MTAPALGPDLLDAINAAFGLAAPRADLDTLLRICEAVHSVLGYDTTPKQRWARHGAHGDPPGTDPAEYWETHLAYGAAGTCYATTLALDAYLGELGFDTTMNAWDLLGRQPGVGFHHATNTVTVDGTAYLLETSSSVPHPLVWPDDGRAVSDPDGIAVLSATRGRTRLHLPRAAAEGTKCYELVAGTVTRDLVIGAYRDAMRIDPARQRQLMWARTRDDQVTASIKGDRYLLRDAHRALHATTVEPPAVCAILAAAGYQDAWLEDLDALGAFG